MHFGSTLDIFKLLNDSHVAEYGDSHNEGYMIR